MPPAIGVFKNAALHGHVIKSVIGELFGRLPVGWMGSLRKELLSYIEPVDSTISLGASKGPNDVPMQGVIGKFHLN